MQLDHVTQVVWIIRHGDRMDNHDPAWGEANAGTANEKDTPLSPIGHIQAADVARAILSDATADRGADGPGGDNQFTVHHIVSSPFLRTIQTALPLYVNASARLCCNLRMLAKW
jgi:broad specificity phosphatase PhoE